MNQVAVASREVLATHARSFWWASVFLPADRADAAAILYALCRLIDDLVDEAPDPHTAATDLASLRAEVAGDAPPRPLVHAYLAALAGPPVAVLALIDGVGSDLAHQPIPDLRALLRYCYGVAGTVGLAMCEVLNVDDADAAAHAVDLGVAMQLTNIARDVAEDARLGRVYLPADRLRAHGVRPEDLLAGRADRAGVAAVVGELLDLADRYYDSADLGMRYIPLRTRGAILVASRVYRAIGVRLRRHGCDALAGRTIVPWHAKLVHVGAAWATLLRLWVAGRGSHDATLHLHLAGLPGCSPP